MQRKERPVQRRKNEKKKKKIGRASASLEPLGQAHCHRSTYLSNQICIYVYILSLFFSVLKAKIVVVVVRVGVTILLLRYKFFFILFVRYSRFKVPSRRKYSNRCYIYLRGEHTRNRFFSFLTRLFRCTNAPALFFSFSFLSGFFHRTFSSALLQFVSFSHLFFSRARVLSFILRLTCRNCYLNFFFFFFSLRILFFTQK